MEINKEVKGTKEKWIDKEDWQKYKGVFKYVI